MPKPETTGKAPSPHKALTRPASPRTASSGGTPRQAEEKCQDHERSFVFYLKQSKTTEKMQNDDPSDVGAALNGNQEEALEVPQRPAPTSTALDLRLRFPEPLKHTG